MRGYLRRLIPPGAEDFCVDFCTGDSGFSAGDTDFSEGFSAAGKVRTDVPADGEEPGGGVYGCAGRNGEVTEIRDAEAGNPPAIKSEGDAAE
jgi:hypothetical protein